MKTIYTEANRWRVAVCPDTIVDPFSPIGWIEEQFAAASQSNGVERRATVEVFWAVSGVLPRALMGGSFTPGGETIRIRIGTLGPVPSGQQAQRQSTLFTPLVNGLSDEFASAALKGLRSALVRHPFPPGVISVSAGAYDESNSSELGFGRAAELLAIILDPGRTRPVDSEYLQDIISGW
jgi:hypothetical protein